MEYVTLGRTNLMVSRSALGTRLLQDISDDGFAEIIDTAYNSGINFFDTSSSYSDVELKLGQAIYSKRKEIIISSGTSSSTDLKISNTSSSSAETSTSTSAFDKTLFTLSLFSIFLIFVICV